MIEAKKLTDATLRRITKSDSTYEDVHISDVPGNVIEEGTIITDTVLANINYKDDNRLEFSISNVDLTPNTNKAIFYAKNGKLYCAIAGYAPLEITSLSTSNFLSKTGTVYANNTSLDYFNINSGLKLFSNRTRIGAIPQRQEDTNTIDDATYFDFSTENILGKVNNIEKLKLSSNVELKNNGSSININSDGDINISHDNESKIELDEERFSLKGKSTDIGIDSTKTKFNCHTNLGNASYGNNKFRLQTEDSLKIKNIQNDTNLITVNTSGVVTYNKMDVKDADSELKTDSTAFKIRTTKEGLYVSNPTFDLQMTGSTVRIKKQETILFEVRSNGDVYIGNKTINDLIQEKINQYDLRRLLTNEITNHISCALNESNIEYTVYFSDTPSSNIIMNVIFVGSNIDNLGRIYRSDTNSYYELTQYYAEDDSEDDYIEIRKVTSSGSYVSTAYFRGIYYRYV